MQQAKKTASTSKPKAPSKRAPSKRAPAKATTPKTTPTAPKKAKPSAKPLSNKQSAKKHGTYLTLSKKKLFPSLPQSNPKALALARNIARWLLEKKAADVVLFDVYQKSSYADVILLASGESERHLSSLSKHVFESLKEDNLRPNSVEGSGNSAWILMDLGDVVVHLFSPEIRALYDLEGLWSDAPTEYFS